MEYILDARTYLPKFQHDSDLMLSIMDCLNVLISSEQPTFEQIKEAYQDLIMPTWKKQKLKIKS